MKFEMPNCGGCRTCELGCSFRHEEEFNPAISSIKIIAKDGAPGFDVLLVEQTEGGTSIPCDGCKDFPVPVCLDFCKERDDLEKIIKNFTQGRKKPAEKADRAARTAVQKG